MSARCEGGGAVDGEGVDEYVGGRVNRGGDSDGFEGIGI